MKIVFMICATGKHLHDLKGKKIFGEQPLAMCLMGQPFSLGLTVVDMLNLSPAAKENISKEMRGAS